MKRKRNKLFMGLSVLIIGFLISSSSLNTLSTKALQEREFDQYTIDSFGSSAWNWNTTEVVSTESTSESSRPSLAVDAAGNVHIAWQDNTIYLESGTDYDIFYKRWDASTALWTTTEVVSTESTKGSHYPSLAVDTLGNVHIAWMDGTDYADCGTDADIFYKRWEASTSSWTTTEVVSTGSTGYSGNPSLAVDATGNVHITWEDYTNYDESGTDADIFYKRWEASTSSWTMTEVVSTESTKTSYDPSLAVDATGNVHITWEDSTNYDESGTDVDIFYKRWEASTSSWTTTEVVSTESISSSISPSLAVDTLGNIHIAWYDFTDYLESGTDQDIFYKRWDYSTSAWTTTEVVSTESTDFSFNPSLAVDTLGNVHIAWEDYTNYLESGTDFDIFYKRWEASTSSWNTTEVVSTESTSGSDNPSLAVDTLGNVVHIAWHDWTDYLESGTDWDIFYKLFTGSPPAAPELAFITPNPTELPTVYLDWNNVLEANTYHVYRSTSYIWSVEGLVPLTTVSSSEYVDIVPSEGSYYYVVVAGNLVGNSSHSNCEFVEVKFPDLDAPELFPILPNPTDSSSISLVWDNIDRATEYHVYRSVSYIWSVEGLTPLATEGSTSYVDTLPSEGYYFYVIVASDGSSNSTHSNCEFVEVKFPELAAPELAPILPNPTDSSSISLAWDSIHGATEYYIYRSTSYIWSVEGLTPLATEFSPSYLDTLPSEGYYFYAIAANDGVKNSTHSNCEYVEYKIPHVKEFSIITGLILGVFVVSLVILKTRKNKLK